VLAVGEVRDVGDPGQPLGLDRFLDLLDDAFGAHEVRQLGDDDALAPGRDVLDPGGRARAEGAPSGPVGVPDPGQTHDLPARRQVRAGHEAHEGLEVGLRVRDEVPRRGHHLHQVVRRHVRGHTDGDPARAVDQEVRQGGRQDLRLGQLVVVVRHEVHDVLVEVARHHQGRRGEPGFGVPGRRGAVVERTEVAVAIDQGQSQGERLRHAHEGVVDRGVPVWVQLAHHLAHHPGGLHVATVRPQAHLGHLVEDPALHRLQAVPRVGQRTGVDDGVGVLEEGVLHLPGDVDVDDPLDRSLVGRRGRAATWHGDDSRPCRTVPRTHTPGVRTPGRTGPGPDRGCDPAAGPRRRTSTPDPDAGPRRVTRGAGLG